jgi:hypothetical protein
MAARGHHAGDRASLEAGAARYTEAFQRVRSFGPKFVPAPQSRESQTHRTQASLPLIPKVLDPVHKLAESFYTP